MKLYVTDDQYDFLVNDAERRGISISKVVRAALFALAKKAASPVKPKSLRPNSVVSDETRADLATLPARPEFGFTKLMSESAAFVEIAGVLMDREAKVIP